MHVSQGRDGVLPVLAPGLRAHEAVSQKGYVEASLAKYMILPKVEVNCSVSSTVR